MDATSLAHWAYAAMLWLSPPEKFARPDGPPELAETPGERRARYAAIAADVVAVLEEGPDFFAGPDGPRRSAATILGVAWLESGYRRDVDLDLGPRARGGGRDRCLLQVRAGGAEGEEISRDRRACFREGLRRLRGSYGACRALHPDHRLAAYAGGTCGHPRAQAASAARLAVVRRLLAAVPPLP